MTAGSTPSPQLAQLVPNWRMTRTLELLQELLDVADAAPEAVARRAGMSTTELHSLRLLSTEPMGPVELARHLGVTSAASSGVVDRLVAHGHVERRPHANDGRRTEVVITDAGRREVLSRLQPMFTGLAAVDGALADYERDVVERYLSGAIDAMRTLL